MMENGRTKTAGKRWEKFLDQHCLASAGPRANLTGMRRLYWGDAHVVRCGAYLYRVTEADFRRVG